MEVICLADFKFNSNRRGRPVGKSCISVPVALCLHDLAFMRAVLQGMELESAGHRFLPEVHSDLRVVRAYLGEVVHHAQLVLQSMGHQNMATALNAVLLNPQLPANTQLPSLSEFAQDLDDPDAWSEAELLDMYRDRYGHEIGQAKAHSRFDVDAALQGLTFIQTAGVRLPGLSDDIEAWLSASLVRHLRPVGILALSDLTALVNRRGKHWYRTVPGIGKDRGLRLVQWLQDHANFLEPVCGGTVSASSGSAMSGLHVPTAGALLRTTGTNALGAQSDQQALQAWLETLDFLSPHTRKAYSRDVARLVLWAHTELNKGLSDLSVLDATAHARFLQNPPAHWCSVSPNAQMKMKGPLSPSSTSRTLAAIGHFYGFLVETQYLKANPFSRVRTPHERGIQMDIQRCFSNAHLALIQQVLMAMPSSAKQRRLVAILALLESTGLRIGEVPSSWAAVVKPFDADAGTVTCLRVVGKGGRERLLPLKSEVLQALRDHAVDQIGTKLIPPDACPLIGCIDEPLNLQDSSHGSLSTGRLRVVLKGFFKEVAMACPPPDMAKDFLRATPHFMRHTFAHRVLNATQGDLAVTQLLLGHKSISTTGIYVKADFSQRIQAIQSLSIQTIKGARYS